MSGFGRDESEVYRCGGCEQLYEVPVTHKVKMGPEGVLVKDEEFEHPRCPHCGTRTDNDRTEVGTVEF